MRVIAIKSDGELALQILGAPFGGPYDGKDRDGEYFDAKTNIHQDFYAEVPLIYSHGFDPKTGKPAEVPLIVGRAKYSHMDESGHWYKAVLDKTSEVAQRLWASALQGLVKASSGAVNYLTRRAKDGHLIEWGIAELSIVDTSEGMHPINPYAVALPMLKAHFEGAGIDFKEPEASGEDAVQTTETLTQKAGNTMEDEKKEPETEAKKAGPVEVDEIDTLLSDMKAAREKKEQENAAKAERAKKIQELVEETMKASPAENGGGFAVNRNLKTKRGDNEGDAFNFYLRTGDRKALKILNESDDEMGGAAVPTDFYSKVVELRDPQSVARRMGAEVITTSRLTINIPTEATRLTAPADTAESGDGTATSRTINEVEPFDTVAVTVDNYTHLLRLSEELVNDAAFPIEQWVANRIAKNYAIKENSALKTCIYADVSNTVDAADDVSLASGDIFNTYYDVTDPYRDGGVWLMKGSVESAVRQIAGSPFLFAQTPQGASGGVGQLTLLGNNPVFNLVDMDAIAADKKVIFFGAPDYVKLVQNGTLTVRRLNERYADTGEIGFVASSRFAMKLIGGGETWTYLHTLAS